MGIRQKILVYELQTSEAIVSHWFYLCLSAYSAIGPCFSSLNGFKGQFARLLKVRQSRKEIMVSLILQKYKRWDNFMYRKLSQCSFFGIEDPINLFRYLLTFSALFQADNFRKFLLFFILSKNFIETLHGGT